MHVRIQGVSFPREAKIIATARLAWSLGFANGRAVPAHPVSDRRQNAHGLFRNRSVTLRPNVQEIVAAIARAGDQIANDGCGTLPIEVGGLITPTIIQSHAGFPWPVLRRCDLLLRSVEVLGNL